MALVQLPTVDDSIASLVQLHNYQLSETSHLRISFSKSTIWESGLTNDFKANFWWFIYTGSYLEPKFCLAFSIDWFWTIVPFILIRFFLKCQEFQFNHAQLPVHFYFKTWKNIMSICIFVYFEIDMMFSFPILLSISFLNHLKLFF
jgi:hypothetical protein